MWHAVGEARAVVVMRLIADAPEERYPTAEVAVHDLLLCQAAPRNGRAELVRSLDERFPPPQRQRALARLAHLLEPDGPNTVLRTRDGSDCSECGSFGGSRRRSRCSSRWSDPWYPRGVVVDSASNHLK